MSAQQIPESEPSPRAEPRSAVRQVDVTADEAGQRLDAFLRRNLTGVPTTRIFRLIRKGEVRVNGKRAAPEQRLIAGDRVRVPPVRIESPDAPRRSRVPPRLQEALAKAVVYEDAELLVINKPAGLAVHGGSGLDFGVIEALRSMRPDESLELAHRLDRDTSGCLLIARKPAALRALHALLREDDPAQGVEKSYLALVAGKWNLGKKRIDVPLRTDTRVSGERTVRVDASGKNAISDFRPVQFFGKTATLMEVTILTGRTHQIRVHAAYAGHPVAGDEKYGDAEFNERLRAVGLDRMFLHAHTVGFTWPGTGRTMNFNTPLPAELHAVLEKIGEIRGGGSRRGGGRPPPRSAAGRPAQKDRRSPRARTK